MRLIIAFIFVFFAGVNTLAQTPMPTLTTVQASEKTSNLSEEVIELRAREVGQSIRCVVCQNQSIDESDASLAQDMRKLVRNRIRQGDSNAQVIAYLQNRYGDFVLLKPPVQSNTYFLWFAPGVLLIFFLIWYVIHVRKRPTRIDTSPLNEEELQRFKELTAKQGQDV